jgi:purine-binding chemotaxis protein CheW
MVKENDIQPAPGIEISGENVIAGLVQVAPRTQEGAPTAGSAAMVLLLDLDALSLTRHLELAA